MKFFALLFLHFLLAPALTMANPVYAIKKGTTLKHGLIADQIIHESPNFWIMKSSVSDLSKGNYYYVQLDHRAQKDTWLKKHGTLYAYQPGEFALIKPNNKQSLLKIASHLHTIGGQCGTVQKLSSMPITPQLASPQIMLLSKDAKVEKTLLGASSKNILTTIDTLVSWGTRFEGDAEGKLAGEKLKTLYENLIPSDRLDIELKLIKHRGSDQESLIVRIIGSDRPDEVVILGSHLDSINKNNNKNAPGADDNASGTATNLEVFKLLMQNKVTPKKTIEIHAYAAEEVGLVGSGEIADSYKKNRVQVVSMVQFDMNGYSKNGNRKIYFVSNGTNKGLTSQMGNLVDTYLNIPWAKQFLIFGSSDHASWSKRGFPVAFPTENPFSFNRSIHTANDKVSNINAPEQMADFAKLGVAYLMHFSGYK